MKLARGEVKSPSITRKVLSTPRSADGQSARALDHAPDQLLEPQRVERLPDEREVLHLKQAAEVGALHAARHHDDGKLRVLPPEPDCELYAVEHGHLAVRQHERHVARVTPVKSNRLDAVPRRDDLVLVAEYQGQLPAYLFVVLDDEDRFSVVHTSPFGMMLFSELRRSRSILRASVGARGKESVKLA